MSTSVDVPPTMRASILHTDLSITTDEREVPTLAADEVLVQVGAVGVCGSDVHYYKHGRIGDFVVDKDIILGHELGGRIVAVGADVDESRIGQRVAVEPQRSCRVRAVQGGALQPLPGHGVLRDATDRRRPVRVRDDPGRLRAPDP